MRRISHVTDAVPSLGVDLDFGARHSSGSDVLVRRDNERGDAKESTRHYQGAMDLTTGSVGATVTWFNPKTEPPDADELRTDLQADKLTDRSPRVE